MLETRRTDRRFTVHLSAVGLANLADGIVQTGVPLIAITLTRSPLLIGLLTAAAWLPWLLLGIPAGVFVDRWDRRRTMLIGLTSRAVVLAGLGVAAATGLLTTWLLVVFAFAYGITEVFTDLAAQAQVPTLVGRDGVALRRANSKLLAVESVANGFVGPPLAGVLMALGAAWVTGAPALVVAAAIIVLAVGLRGRFSARRPGNQEQASMGIELREGISTVWRHPVLRPMLIAAGVWNFGGTAISALLLLWLVGPGSAGGLTPQVWSLALIALPIGAVIGSSVAGPAAQRLGEMRVVVVCWGINALLNLLPLLWPGLWSLVAFLFGAGLFGVMGNVIGGSIRPRMVPEHLLGRVQGAARVVAFGSMPLGALIGGQVAELFGIPVVIVGVVVLMLASTAFVGAMVPQRLVDAHELRGIPEDEAAPAA